MVGGGAARRSSSRARFDSRRASAAWPQSSSVRGRWSVQLYLLASLCAIHVQQLSRTLSLSSAQLRKETNKGLQLGILDGRRVEDGEESKGGERRDQYDPTGYRKGGQRRRKGASPLASLEDQLEGRIGSAQQRLEKIEGHTKASWLMYM